MASNHAEAAFDALYAAHRQTLHAYFVGRTADEELALDLLQEALVRLWRNLASVAELSAERQRAWLLTVARNLVTDHYRARATRHSTSEALEREAFVADTTAPPADADVLHRERLDQLDAAIRRLPDDLRTVLVLQVLGERTSAEIGELLGRPPGTVRYQLAEARRRLARELQLNPDEEPEP